MQSQNSISNQSTKENLINFFIDKWDQMGDRQKKYAKKAWNIITYKWRWQIAMNIPYMAIFALDRTVPQVHQFNISLLSSITTKFPLPAFITSLLGLG